jgi:hypothetical protein
MIFEFIDLTDAIRIKADNKDRTFPKNYLYVEASPLDSIIKIKSIEHRLMYEINYGVDTLIPAQATKEEFIQFLAFFFRRC